MDRKWTTEESVWMTKKILGMQMGTNHELPTSNAMLLT